MEKGKIEKGTKKIKYVMFYLFVMLYFIIGSIIIYRYVQNYKHFQKLPKYIGSLYILHDNYLFLKPILISFFLNCALTFYLIKNFSKDIILKYVSIFLGISITFLLIVNIEYFQHLSLPPLLGIALYFLFLSRISIQNFTIFAFSLLIFFPIKVNISTKSRLEKVIVISLGLLINFILMSFFFPQYWIGPVSLTNYFQLLKGV